MTDERTVLLVVDVQNDFCTGGSLAVAGGEDVVPVINALAKRFSHVVLTQDWHPPGHSSFASSHPGGKPFELVRMPYGRQVLWPDHCVQGTRGRNSTPTSTCRRPRLSSARAIGARSTAIPDSWRRIAGRRPA